MYRVVQKKRLILSKSAQCRKDFGRNNVPDGRTIQRLLAKFQKTGSVVDAHKGRYRSSFGIVPENIQNFWEHHNNPPENQHSASHKKLVFQEHQFWGSSMMTLSSFLTKFWSCRGKLIKIKQNKKHFVKISVNRLKMTLTCWIWTMLTTVAFVGHCYTFCLKRWIVLLSGTLFLPKSLLHCRCVRRTDFVAKYASVIFTGCCVVSRPVGSILVSRESPRPAVYITWKIWKKKL